jgi:hypothetical protein
MLSPEFENILEKYRKQKLNTYAVLELLGTDYVFNNYGADESDKRYRELLECGTQLFFEKEIVEGSPRYHLTGANFCRQRICPMCQFRKSEKMFTQMMAVCQALEGYRFLHLVLTIPNASTDYELVQGVKILYKGFSKLMEYKEIRRAYKGVLRCLEVSFNCSSVAFFHPHLHCLVAVRRSYFNDSAVYLKADRVQEIWTESVRKAVKALGFSGCFADYPDLLQIHVGAVKEGDYSGVAEVCKYSVKPLELDKLDNAEQNKRALLCMAHVLKGTRLVQKYGVIRETFNRLFRSDEEPTGETGKSGTAFIRWNDVDMKYYREG